MSSIAYGSSVVYLYPNGAKAPTQAQMEKKFSAVHAVVNFPADGPPAPPNTPTSPPMAVEVIHNMQFDTAAPVEALQTPLIIVNPSGGTGGAYYAAVPNADGNGVTITKLGAGSIALDVWIFRPAAHGGIFGH